MTPEVAGSLLLTQEMRTELSDPDGDLPTSGCGQLGSESVDGSTILLSLSLSLPSKKKKEKQV